MKEVVGILAMFVGGTLWTRMRGLMLYLCRSQSEIKALVYLKLRCIYPYRSFHLTNISKRLAI